MGSDDSAPKDVSIYECVDCGRRVEEGDLDGRLCTCGGYLQNISVPRSQ